VQTEGPAEEERESEGTVLEPRGDAEDRTRVSVRWAPTVQLSTAVCCGTVRLRLSKKRGAHTTRAAAERVRGFPKRSQLGSGMGGTEVRTIFRQGAVWGGVDWKEEREREGAKGSRGWGIAFPSTTSYTTTSHTVPSGTK
jgi:hypothetical protein